MLKRYLSLLALFLSLGIIGFASEEESPVKARLISENSAISAGQEFSLLLDVELAPEWHAYWKNPGSSGMAPSIEWELPPGITVKEVEWPVPERFEDKDFVTFGYSEEAPFLVTLVADKDLSPQDLEIKALLQWLVCSNETCLPGNSETLAKVSIAETAKLKEENLKRFAEVRDYLPEKMGEDSFEQFEDKLLVSLPKDDEIALNETPLFFPEMGENLSRKVTVSKQEGKASVSIPTWQDEEHLKGLLVIGDYAYDIDVATALNAPENIGFFWAIAFALLGGLLLNLMPCVLPVVSLKIMSFMKMAGQSRTVLIKHGVFFTLGVLISFWVLAGLLILLQWTGQAIGWGFQLQNPFFISCLALLFALIGLSLFGVFEIGTGLASMAGDASLQGEKKGYEASFLGGVFATAVATPCTGPFMGSALGYGLTQPAYVSMAIFTAIGLGMSLPYLLLGIFPSLIRFLPKPGAWMESFKQFLGFLMLATVIWLLWVFSGQTSSAALFIMLFALLMSAIGAWIYGRWGAPYRSRHIRKVGYVLAALFLIGSLSTAHVASTQTYEAEVAMNKEWEPFSSERLKELRAKNIPVLIDFTAKWCLICQANHVILTQSDVAKKLDERGVVRMKADWTRHDPEITAELKKYGRSGVPLYVFYHETAKEAKILPQVLTPDNVISAIDSKTEAHVRR